MTRAPILLLILLIILGCQVVPTPPALRSTPRKIETSTRVPLTEGPEPPTEIPVSTSSLILTTTATTREAPIIPMPTLEAPTPAALPGELADLAYLSSMPFADVPLGDWNGQKGTAGWQVSLPARRDEINNFSVTNGLTTRQRDQLISDGFVIVHSQEQQFFDLHQRVSLEYGQTYLLTTDAAYHALKITWDEVIRALEKEELQRRLTGIVRATYQQVVGYFPLVAGSPLEAETRLAAAYLGVGLILLDPQAALDPKIETDVTAQVRQVMDAAGLEEARLLPGFEDDFRKYRPGGYYAGDADLEAYFRGLTWLERVSFPTSEIGPRAYSYHVPLILTLALRQAQTESGAAGGEWAELAETFDFLYGRRTGGGPVEFAAIMDQAYGRRATVLSLQDDPEQETLRSLLRDLPFPLSSAGLLPDLVSFEAEKSWSFIGRREALDAVIIVRAGKDQPLDSDAARWMPGGLELMSVLGSRTAYETLKTSGDVLVDFNLLDELRGSVMNRFEEQWTQSSRDLWLDSYRSRIGDVALDGTGQLPGFASISAWDYKELNSALGSWAEQQYQTSEFMPASAEMEEPAQPASPPAPGFVEPNPQVFYKLARLGFMLAEGLKERDLTGVFSTSPSPEGLNQLTLDLIELAERLQRLGDIAKRELAGEELNVDDFTLIHAPLGPAERRLFMGMQAQDGATNVDMPPLSGTAAIEYGDRILHIGNGNIDRIYMLVPVRGEITIAQGGIFSYYEFSLPERRRLDETSWRWRLANDPLPRPAWTAELYHENEGTPIDVLAYRIGDIYRVLPAAGNLGLRSSPNIDAQIIQIAGAGELFEIIDGPRDANGLRWWKVRMEREDSTAVEGWIHENQEWIERVWKR